MVEDAQILETLQQTQDNLDGLVDLLVQSANEAGGKDNITVITIKTE